MWGQDEHLELWLEMADQYPNATLYGFDSQPPWLILSDEDFNRGMGGTIWPIAHAHANGPSLIITDMEMMPISPRQWPLLANITILVWVPGRDLPVPIDNYWRDRTVLEIIVKRR